MSRYTDTVERSLRGLEAVSTGVCPGCPECMERWSYVALDGFGERNYWGIPARPDAGRWLTERGVADAARELFDVDYSSGVVESESGFSWKDCGICGSTLGGNREAWHARDAETKALCHFDDACTDCGVYLTNGDEPEEWDPGYED
jgi:hypothetical protein